MIRKEELVDVVAHKLNKLLSKKGSNLINLDLVNLQLLLSKFLSFGKYEIWIIYTHTNLALFNSKGLTKGIKFFFVYIQPIAIK